MPPRTLDQLMSLRHRCPGAFLTDIQLDSRRVGPGSLFVAIRGHQMDGRRFIEQAVAQGATAVLFEEDGPVAPATSIPAS
jgi:UDP-N-acetylmuramoyl-L-alanyl-D-glutamate--2,6-diaminopimelate ligase